MSMSFKGRYVTDKIIRENGVSTLYSGKDLHKSAPCMIDVLQADQTHIRQRYDREALIWSSLKHPNVAKVIDHGEESGVHFMVLEQNQSTGLHTRIKNGSLKVMEAKPILLGICEGLAAIHSAGIVHSDVKPGKIRLESVTLFLSVTEEPKILPSGLARFLVGDIPAEPGCISGTLAYMSPEHLTPGSAADIRSDIYSFGVLMFEVLTGTLPFMGSTPLETMQMHKNDAPPVPSTITPLYHSVDTLVMRALEKDPMMRFQSAAELKAALSAL